MNNYSIRLLGASIAAIAFSVINISVANAAADGANFNVSGSFTKGVALTTDYRFRGISRTFGDPAIQGFAEFNFPNNFYIGTKASTIDKQVIPDNRGIEWDINGGYRFELDNGLKFDVGMIQYIFWGQSSLATLEGYGGVTWEFLSLKYSHALSNKFFGSPDGRGSAYIDLGGKYPIGSGFHAFAHYGIQKISSSSADYSDYSFGVEKEWYGANWTAGMYGTDSKLNAIAVNGRVRNLGARGLVLTVSKSF
ncbi:MAG: TorF family putative porin [Burkholderiaceae bacterium]